MLDINDFREEKGGDPERIRESQRRRYADPGLVDKVIDLDKRWREVRFRVDQLKKELNKLSKEIGQKMKAKEDASGLREKSIALKADISAAEADEGEVAAARDAAILPIGNLVHDSVPVSNDEANNVVVKEVGAFEQAGRKHNHVDLVRLLDIVDLDAGVSVAGGRGYFLKGAGVLLNQALINAALALGTRRGLTPVQTPFFMRKSVMAQCAQLSQFDEELYHVTGEGEDKYLIATSEQPLCALHRGQWLEDRELPRRYVGYSTCFRKEAGSHGRDTLGIFRVHQFEKVEQFVITSPEGDASWAALDDMLATAEEFYQMLGLPYRVVNIVSGELNAAAAKKYDLEAWFPASQTHRELVSCSNCTDYQARRLDVRVRLPAGGAGDKASGVAAADGRQATRATPPAKGHVHMLNSTMVATERALCCVLENYQEEGGVRVPEALQPYLPGLAFLPFVKMFDAKGRLVDADPTQQRPAVAT